MWTDLGHVNKPQRSIFTAATATRCVYAVPLGFRSVAAAAATRCVHSLKPYKNTDIDETVICENDDLYHKTISNETEDNLDDGPN